MAYEKLIKNNCPCTDELREVSNLNILAQAFLLLPHSTQHKVVGLIFPKPSATFYITSGVPKKLIFGMQPYFNPTN